MRFVHFNHVHWILIERINTYVARIEFKSHCFNRSVIKNTFFMKIKAFIFPRNYTNKACTLSRVIFFFFYFNPFEAIVNFFIAPFPPIVQRYDSDNRVLSGFCVTVRKAKIVCARWKRPNCFTNDRAFLMPNAASWVWAFSEAVKTHVPAAKKQMKKRR